MIAGDDHFVRVGQRANPLAHVREFVERSGAQQITRVHKDITLGDDEIALKSVRVGDGHNPHGNQGSIAGDAEAPALKSAASSFASHDQPTQCKVGNFCDSNCANWSSASSILDPA
jgi:hypothetical protein